MPGDGDLKVSAGSRVRTGTGFIELAAGGDLRFADAGSVATLGRPDAAIADFPVPNVGGNPAVFPVAGGDIRLDIAGNLSAAAPDQLVTGWLFRQGNLTPEDGTLGSGSDSRTGWWVRFVDFRQGIGALGGGDIEARIRGDAVNPGFSIPTTGRLAGAAGTLPDPSRLVIRGGGDLDLQVGGDVLSGVFHLGAGQGRVAVGGKLDAARAVTVAGQPRPVYSQFGLGAGAWELQVRQSAHVGGVFTPTLLPLVTANSRSSYFSTYAADSAFRVTSVAGDLVLENDGEVIGVAFPPLLAGDAGNDAATAAVSLYPPVADCRRAQRRSGHRAGCDAVPGSPRWLRSVRRRFADHRRQRAGAGRGGGAPAQRAATEPGVRQRDKRRAAAQCDAVAGSFQSAAASGRCPAAAHGRR